MKTLIKLVLVLVVGLLAYNYFYGDADEKAQSEKIFNEIKDLGVAVKDLLKDEHQKFKDGKYEQVLANLKDAYGKIEETAQKLTPENREKLESLKKERDRLTEQMDKADSDEEKSKYRDELKKLLEDTDKLLDEI